MKRHNIFHNNSNSKRKKYARFLERVLTPLSNIKLEISRQFKFFYEWCTITYKVHESEDKCLTCEEKLYRNGFDVTLYDDENVCYKLYMLIGIPEDPLAFSFMIAESKYDDACNVWNSYYYCRNSTTSNIPNDELKYFYFASHYKVNWDNCIRNWTKPCNIVDRVLNRHMPDDLIDIIFEYLTPLALYA